MNNDRIMSDIVDKSDFLESLSEEELNSGYIKFNIPDPKTPDSLNGEGVWGWCTPEDKALYHSATYQGKIKAILCNTPIVYYGLLFWGAEVQLICHGENRPTLDYEWLCEIIEKIPKENSNG